MPLESSQRRPDIALIVPSLRGGGAERVTVTLANEFAARGLATDLVLFSAEGPFLADVALSVRVVDLGTRRASRSIVALSGYFRRTRPAIAISGMTHCNLATLAASAVAGSPPRLCVVEHSNQSKRFTSEADRGKVWLMRRLIRLLYPRAAGVVAVSEGGRVDLLRLFPQLEQSRVTAIYNPVNTNIAALPLADHPWLVENAVPVVIGAGRLETAKAFDTLLAAFAIARRIRPLRLLILGDGSLRNALADQTRQLGIAAHVDFIGFVRNPHAYMAKAGCFVLSSRREGFAIVLVEALAAGCPVVSTECPSGPAEILEKGRYGRLVPVDNPEAMASAIVAALDDPGDCEARRMRASEFSVERSADAYIRFMELPDRGALAGTCPS